MNPFAIKPTRQSQTTISKLRHCGSGELSRRGFFFDNFRQCVFLYGSFLNGTIAYDNIA